MCNKKTTITLIAGLILASLASCFGDERRNVSDSKKIRITEKIIAMEEAALERWGNGDPDGFLEIIAEDYTYFDPFIDARVDGYANINEMYDNLRGQVDFDRFELINPKVQVSGKIAVLTFNFKSFGELEDGTVGERSHWHTTEVFQEFPDGWKLISTHWSYTNSKLKQLAESGAFATGEVSD